MSARNRVPSALRRAGWPAWVFAVAIVLLTAVSLLSPSAAAFAPC